jgi:O-antigen ligase
MTKLIIALLIISQIILLPTISFRWIKELSAQIFILIALCFLIWRRNKFISLFVGWNIFLFFVFKSYLINDFNQTVTYNLNVIALLNLINIVLYGFFYYILHEIKLDKDLIYKTFCFIAIFEAIYVILQYLQLDQFFYNFSFTHHFRDGSKVEKHLCWPVGTLANEALMSWLLAMLSPFFLAYKELRYKIGYFIVGTAIICTKVSVGIAGFILGFLFWLFFKNRKLAILFIILVLIGSVFLVLNKNFEYYLSDTHRFLVWKKTLSIWKDMNAEITGCGLGSFRILFWQKAPEFRTDGQWSQVHNEYLQVLFEQGIIGLGIILGLMWFGFYNFWKKREKRVGLIPITSLFIFSLVALLGFPMRTSMGIIPIMSLVLFEKELNGTSV